MPSEALTEDTAHCHCGASERAIKGPPETVAYCHCDDCRRWTDAPVAGFAAFAEDAVTGQMPEPQTSTVGVRRWPCTACGSPLGDAFDHLPDRKYVPLGIIDQADAQAPVLHSHHAARLPWLHIADDLHRSDGTAGAGLKGLRA